MLEVQDRDIRGLEIVVLNTERVVEIRKRDAMMRKKERHLGSREQVDADLMAFISCEFGTRRCSAGAVT